MYTLKDYFGYIKLDLEGWLLVQLILRVVFATGEKEALFRRYSHAHTRSRNIEKAVWDQALALSSALVLLVTAIVEG